MSTRNVLDDIFSMDEEDTETFMEAVKENYGVEEDRGPKFDDQESGYNLSKPVSKTQESGLIRIIHGIEEASYIWHIAPNHPKRTWKCRPEHLLLAVQKIFSTVIPQSTQVWIWAPDPEWEIAEWSFRAQDLMNEWSVGQDDIDSMNVKLFEVLNSLM